MGIGIAHIRPCITSLAWGVLFYFKFVAVSHGLCRFVLWLTFSSFPFPVLLFWRVGAFPSPFSFLVIIPYPAEYGAKEMVSLRRCPDAGVWLGTRPGGDADSSGTHLGALCEQSHVRGG